MALTDSPLNDQHIQFLLLFINSYSQTTDSGGSWLLYNCWFLKVFPSSLQFSTCTCAELLF